MHNNYYFLRQLSIELGNILSGCVISECYSQDKDELIIRFETPAKPFFIRASLQSSFCCLSFPTEFNRARKNSIDLFTPIIGQRVENIRQFANERSFSLQLSGDLSLLFKMHGNRSNIILVEGQKVVSIFRNHLEADFSIQPDNLDKDVDWSREAFQKHSADLKRCYFTFGKAVWHYLDENKFSSKNEVDQWETLQEVRKLLEQPTYYIVSFRNESIFSLLPFGKIIRQFNNPVQAISEFYPFYTSTNALQQEKANAISTLASKIRNHESYIRKSEAKLQELKKDKPFKLWGDVIMANLQQIPPNAESAVLANVYENNRPIEIRLRKEWSAQKNAEVYYKKSKNQQTEINKLEEGLGKKKGEAESLNEKIKQIEQADDLKSLRKLVNTMQGIKATGQPEKALPYREFEFLGFKIWIGKDAQRNDELTQKHSFKEDLWLHAKDVSGSHVLIKYQAGKKFPKEVIERAAQLAAFYSKRKTETLCPVAVTPKKHVRKRKGDPPGTVVVEKEKVLMVEPREFRM